MNFLGLLLSYSACVSLHLNDWITSSWYYAARNSARGFAPHCAVASWQRGRDAILILILAPTVASYGIDPVQFGVMVVLNLIIGTVTPPVGVVLFVVTRIAEIRFEVMARAILPWLIPLLVVLAAITVYPPLTLALAAAMRGG